MYLHNTLKKKKKKHGYRNTNELLNSFESICINKKIEMIQGNVVFGKPNGQIKSGLNHCNIHSVAWVYFIVNTIITNIQFNLSFSPTYAV